MTPTPGEVLGSRPVRLRSLWFLLPLFFLFARPTAVHLLVGGSLAGAGALLRAWSAGHIAKDRRLATSGPYAHTRHPLYLGSLLLGLGATLAAGRWIYVPLFLVFYAVVYGRTIHREERILAETFGEEFRRYRRRVPRLFPRTLPSREREGSRDHTHEEEGPFQSGSGFSLARYLRNREWEAALGLVAGFALLAGKMLWSG